MPSITLQKFSIAHYVLLALLFLITLAGAIPMFGLATTCTLTFILGTVLGSLYITSGIDFDQLDETEDYDILIVERECMEDQDGGLRAGIGGRETGEGNLTERVVFKWRV